MKFITETMCTFTINADLYLAGRNIILTKDVK